MLDLKKLILPVIGSFILIVAACKKSDNPTITTVSKSGLLVNTSQEVPVITNSNATGTMNVTYDKSTKLLTYTVNWAMLSDSIVSSHIHGTAARGVAGPVVVPFTITNRGALTGSYSGTFTVDGVAIKEDSLLLGYYYLNIHTKKNPGGELGDSWNLNKLNFTNSGW